MKREYGFWSAFLGMADPSPKQEQIKNKSMKYDHSQIFYTTKTNRTKIKKELWIRCMISNSKCDDGRTEIF